MNFDKRAFVVSMLMFYVHVVTKSPTALQNFKFPRFVDNRHGCSVECIFGVCGIGTQYSHRAFLHSYSTLAPLIRFLLSCAANHLYHHPRKTSGRPSRRGGRDACWVSGASRSEPSLWILCCDGECGTRGTVLLLRLKTRTYANNEPASTMQ